MTFIHISPFVSKKAEEVIHLIQETESKVLHPKNKWDIRGRMQDVANHERHKFDAVQEVNWLYRWEQLENRVKREKGAVTADKVLLWMYMLENRQSIKLWKGQSEDDCKKHAVMMLSRELVIR